MRPGQINNNTRYGPQPCLRYLAPSLARTWPSHPGRGGRCAEMARLIGATPAAVTNWARGKRLPPPWARVAIAEQLGLPLERCWSRHVLAGRYDGRGTSQRDA